MPNANTILGLGLTHEELNNIDEYRRKKNTAVLTIMFTDIQGFTSLTEEKGESYVHELHAIHDKILVDAIEENNAGYVIKYIGDAIMAVFSEPTAAVEKSLKIQKKLDAFNKEHPEWEDLKVRIGLHMGQTVIENKMQVDLFGRHVNKASRIEGLAGGGHVYMSYPVFDSAKSWLMDNHGAAYICHGSYFLKGIQKPEEIYEVYNQDITKPQAPKKAKKSGSRLKPVLIAAGSLAALVIGGIVLLLINLKPVSTKEIVDKTDESTELSNSTKQTQTEKSSSAPADETVEKQKTAPTVQAPAQPQFAEEVRFTGMYAQEPVLDLYTPLAFKVLDEKTNLIQALNDFSVGRHVIHFVVSEMVWYFAEFEVKTGKNIININFVRSEIPSAQINLFLESEPRDTDTRDRENSYFYYEWKSGKKVQIDSSLHLEVSGEKVSADFTNFTITYTLSLNSKVVCSDTIIVKSPADASETTVVPRTKIYEDGYHFYTLDYHYFKDSIQVVIDSGFKDPK